MDSDCLTFTYLRETFLSCAQVYDNFVGIAATKGKVGDPDPYCITAFGQDACIGFAKSQHSPLTFIDHLAEGGVNVTLYGKMHAGAGLTEYPGELEDFPFSNPAKSSDSKTLREWTRGLGPDINVKGKDGQTPNLQVPDSEPKPATANDYKTLASCLSRLRSGLIRPGGPAQFLYCSLLVPHPPYASNKTYMDAVAM